MAPSGRGVRRLHPKGITESDRQGLLGFISRGLRSPLEYLDVAKFLQKVFHGVRSVGWVLGHHALHQAREISRDVRLSLAQQRNWRLEVLIQDRDGRRRRVGLLAGHHVEQRAAEGPNLEKLLPAAVQVRVEGRYRDTNEAFVARVAVTPDGFVTADARRPIDTEKNLKKLRHKIDVRHERVALRLACDRFCSRRANDATVKESTESDSKSTEDDPSGGVTDTTESSRSFPDRKGHLLPGAGHYSPEDSPVTVTRLVAEFAEAS